MCLTGHDNTVGAIVSQRENPQVITGSYDSTVKLWDLAAGKCATTLTHHKKGVRALALHPREFTLFSASADNIKKFGTARRAAFKHNMLSKQRSIVNALAVSEDDVVVSGGDDGSLWFWDYNSSHCFQKSQACNAGIDGVRGGNVCRNLRSHRNAAHHRRGGQDDQDVETGRGRVGDDAPQPPVRAPERHAEVLIDHGVLKCRVVSGRRENRNNKRAATSYVVFPVCQLGMKRK